MLINKGTVYSQDEKLDILRFDYSWAEAVQAEEEEEEERKNEVCFKQILSMINDKDFKRNVCETFFFLIKNDFLSF